MHIEFLIDDAEHLTLCWNQFVSERFNVLIGCLFNAINQFGSLGLLDVFLGFCHHRPEIRLRFTEAFKGLFVSGRKVIEHAKSHSIDAGDRVGSYRGIRCQIPGNRVHSLIQFLEFKNAEKRDSSEQ